MKKLKSNQSRRTRFAIYTRYSSDLQNELSLEAQEEQCRRAIADLNGVVVAVFSDGAKSGWSLERDGFNQLRIRSERGHFDAVMFWKFDRLARNHDHAVMIKILLRHEYGLKLYCVEGFSEDEDDSPYTAMMEQMLAVFSAFYSKNLSNETKRGKRQRAVNGQFNGSIPPIGYRLVSIAEATEQEPPGLYLEPRLAVLIRRAFRMYATGNHSDINIAEWMNDQPIIQQLREGRKPIGKEMVREMLQNRIYTGRVPYAETLYSGSLGQGKKSNRGRKQWFEGQHIGFISDELFDTCQEVRSDLTVKRRSPSVMHTYILHDRVFCARCAARKPTDLVDSNYGKMRPGWNSKREMGWYRCLARDRGYHKCPQPLVRVNILDEQVASELASLTIPAGFRERVEHAIRSRVEHEEALRRIAEIEEIVGRIDFSWEKGFLSPDEYVEKRSQLQREIESVRPIAYDDLMEAADLLENFSSYWQNCQEVANPDEARKQLLSKIVDRVFVYDDNVIAIALHGDYAVVLEGALSAPTELVGQLREGMKKGTSNHESACAQSGSDGGRSLTCKFMVVMFLPRYINRDYPSYISSFTGILSPSKPTYQVSISTC